MWGMDQQRSQDKGVPKDNLDGTEDVRGRPDKVILNEDGSRLVIYGNIYTKHVADKDKNLIETTDVVFSTLHKETAFDNEVWSFRKNIR